MQLSEKADFIPVPDWYYGVEYLEEQRRGYDYSEDLFVPGFFEVEAKEGDSIVFSASTKEEKPSGFKQKFAKTVSGKIPRDNFVDCLRNAAQQFIERRGGSTLIIAGYPWFGDWGRDTFISLPGLVLARQKLSLYTDVLDTQIKRLRNGLFPNVVAADNPVYNSVDASLWFFWTLQNYLSAGGSDVWERYGDSAKSIIASISKGEAENVTMRDNGLLYADTQGKALTWMDAVVSGEHVTRRNGYTVEINALWYNAVSFALERAKAVKDKKFLKEYGHLPELIKSSFISLFWVDKLGYLADYVSDTEINKQINLY